MTEVVGDVTRLADVVLESALDAVRRAVLELLDALPDRPDRLRLQAADVVVDMDWRTSAAPFTSAAPLTSGTPRKELPTDVPWQVTAGSLERPPARTPEQPAEENRPARHYICAPSVGAFYRAPEPGAPPFIADGATVNAGQQVAIIEVMKLMLPVEADRRGRVVEVLIEDGQVVEYGERLLALEPLDNE